MRIAAIGTLFAMVLAAQSPNELLRRGMERFQAGQIEDSVQDFDQLARLDPSAAPHLWQRGIALYYMGRFKDCQAQFAQHRKVNPEDVENSAWHYLCTARAESPAKARQTLIPSTQDARPPMLTVLSMYAGKATQDDVLHEADRHGSTAKFFAYLYIGLYWEAQGDRAKAAPWLQRAAEASADQDYMGTVARIHWTRFQPKK